MFMDTENKENETQPDNERASKQLAEPPGQKPRRSVLKAFDPFAPDSPCVPAQQQQLKPPNVTVDEEEVFEDAETSLTSYVCPRNINSEHNSEKLKPPNKSRESWLINLKGNCQEERGNLNDTADMSYVEAVENLSPVDNDVFLDKTSSEEDFEFNLKKQNEIPDILVHKPENSLLCVTNNTNRTDASNEENVMIDSLEHTPDSKLNSTIENVVSTLVLIQTESINPQREPNNGLEAMSEDLNKAESEIRNKEIGYEEPAGNCQEERGNLNDTTDMNDVEAVENLSPVDKEVLLDKASSEEDCELNLKKQNEIPDTLVHKPENRADAFNEGNVMIDSLEHTPDSELNSTIENVVSALVLIQTESMNPQREPNNGLEAMSEDLNKAESEIRNKEIDYEEPGGMADSLELSSPREDILVSNCTIDNQVTLIDSLEVLKSEDNLHMEETSLSVTEQELQEKILGDNILNDKNKFELQAADTMESNNIELNKTFEEPFLNTTTSRSDKPQSDETNTLNAKELFEAPSVATLESNIKQIQSDQIDILNPDVLDQTVVLDKSKPVIEENVNQIELISQCKEECPQQIKSEIQKTEVLNSDSTLQEIISTPVPAANFHLKVSASTEPTEPNEDYVKTAENESVQNSRQKEKTVNIPTQSVSLNDIIDLDASNKNDIKPDNVNESNSKVPFPVKSSFNDINSTFTTEERAAESSKAMEALAESLNQTIDVEESAIVDDINSSNTSGDLSNEGLAVTINNTQDGSSRHESSNEVKGDKKSVEKTEERGKKSLERKETEEFEDLERQYNDKSQSTEQRPENQKTKSFEEKVDTAVEEHSKAFYRQDTREFEVLEQECNENSKNINASDTQKGTNFKAVPRSNEEVKRKNTNFEEKAHIEEEKSIENQDTQEFEQLERECTTNGQRPIEFTKETAEQSDVPLQVENGDNTNLKQPINLPVEAVLTTTDSSLQPIAGQVKVKVSGNICNANSVTEECVQNKTKSRTQQPFTGINLKYDVNKEKELKDNMVQKSVSNSSQSTNGTPECKTKSEVDSRKDKYILKSALDLEDERDKNIKLKKVIKNYEQFMEKQTEDLKALKKEEEINCKRFTSLEMAFADLFEKYEKSKSVIGVYKKNEEILQRNVQNAEEQLTKLDAKCSVTKEQYSERLKKVEEQMLHEKEKYRQDIAKLQAMAKRLEIKCSSLETALKQKTVECQALASLCDDITGKPM